jgi:hypothetical protein
MSRKMWIVIFLAVVAFITFTSCEQWTTRILGGNTTIELEKNEKLVNITWKDSNIWYLVREMRSDEVAETLVFKESSVAGLTNGTVTIIERR